ncbi:hypothetical protein EG68_06600, partial [Paragonimus skrjabini miyazakii]
TINKETKEVGCDCRACNAITYIVCFYDYRWSSYLGSGGEYRICNDSSRLNAHVECNSGSTWSINHRFPGVGILRIQQLIFVCVSASVLHHTYF